MTNCQGFPECFVLGCGCDVQPDEVEMADPFELVVPLEDDGLPALGYATVLS